MTKKETIEKILMEEGFELRSDLHSYKGPKAKSDILECWSAQAIDTRTGRRVEIYSAHTMTELCRRGLRVVQNSPETCLYGDFVAVPKI